MRLFASTQSETIEIERLRSMTLGQFRFANTWVKIESDLLPSLNHGDLYICSDKNIEREIKAKHKSAVVYGPAELKRIIALDPGPEAMKQIHAAKAILGGRVIETKPELPYPEPGPIPTGGGGPRLQKGGEV